MSSSPSATIAPSDFVRKWSSDGTANRLNERAGAQAHFIDLCRLLGVPEPNDPDRYCFERGFRGIGGSQGFADVWKQGCFAWEYKKPGSDLRPALQQLMQYVLPLENPPLLVVSDRLRIEIHTHFNGFPTKKFELLNKDLNDRRNLDLLRQAFMEPYRLKPEKDSKTLTAELAAGFATIAESLRKRGCDPFAAAHFLTQCMFCFFADGAGVLPSNVFRRVVRADLGGVELRKTLDELFHRMSTGGRFGVDIIPWFNGGLFGTIFVPLLTDAEVQTLVLVSESDWRSIDASIFGTLFERGLDPSKRSQLGAHYTDAETIERLIRPVICLPLQESWDEAKRRIVDLLSERDDLRARAKEVPSGTAARQSRFAQLRSKANRCDREAKNVFAAFLEKLRAFRVLDPACGSGNFLYLSLKALKDIELRANVDAEELGLHRQLPVTGPHNVLGLEVNEYAAELARATVWIGELQWLGVNGIDPEKNPLLKPLRHIECRDALLNAADGEAAWPEATVVVGNPPFIGDKKMRSELGDAYTQKLRRVFAGRVPGGADLVCYWFEKARSQIENKMLCAAGLVATNSIRGGRSRAVLDRVVGSTRIFEAWSDEPWVNEGASVRVSLIAFGAGPSTSTLDGSVVSTIGPELASLKLGAMTMSGAAVLNENLAAAFQGPTKGGRFDIPGAQARQWLAQPTLGRSNSMVLHPWANGDAIVGRWPDQWIIDFGSMPIGQAALHEGPFEWVVKNVKPDRDHNAESRTRENFWQFKRSGADCKAAVRSLSRFIVTPEVSKHRVFTFLEAGVAPDKNVVVIARSDDATFGVLQSRFHECWSLQQGTSLEDRPRYTSKSTFRTYPFPLGLTPAETAHQRVVVSSDGSVVPADLPSSRRMGLERVAAAASRLHELRSQWLDPADWVVRLPEAVPLGMERSPYAARVVPKDDFQHELAQRTLTKLYNGRPSWLVLAHHELDAAVAEAYGWSDYQPDMPDEEILRRLLALNLERARHGVRSQTEMALLGAVSDRKTAKKRRAEVPAKAA